MQKPNHEPYMNWLGFGIRIQNEKKNFQTIFVKSEGQLWLKGNSRAWPQFLHSNPFLPIFPSCTNLQYTVWKTYWSFYLSMKNLYLEDTDTDIRLNSIMLPLALISVTLAVLWLWVNHCWRVWVLANWQHSWLRWYWPFCVLLINILSFVNDIVCISFSTCSKRIDMYCRQ